MNGDWEIWSASDGGKKANLQTVVDLHVDTLPRISAGEGRFATGEGKLQVDLERCTRGSVRLLLTALYTTDGAPDPWGEVERMLGVRDQEQGLRTVTSPSQLETLQADEVGSLASLSRDVGTGSRNSTAEGSGSSGSLGTAPTTSLRG